MSDKPKKQAIVVNDSRPLLVDLEGNDALLLSPHATKIQVQKYAIAALPLLFSKAIHIIQSEDSAKRDVIDAMKFVKTLSDGEIKAKAIQSVAKMMNDAEIVEALNGIEESE